MVGAPSPSADRSRAELRSTAIDAFIVGVELPGFGFDRVFGYFEVPLATARELNGLPVDAAVCGYRFLDGPPWGDDALPGVEGPYAVGTTDQNDRPGRGQIMKRPGGAPGDRLFPDEFP